MTDAIASGQLRSVYDRQPTVSEILNLKPARTSEYTFEEQAGALEFVLGLIDGCLGHSARDSYRAYALGSSILGFKFDSHRSLFRDARLYGHEAAVRMHPNIIRHGELIGWTYFAADSAGQLLKIGHSQKPKSRIASLQTTTGKTLTEIHRKKGFELHEHRWHLRARAAWMGGEWFDLPLLLQMDEFQFLRGAE